MKKSEKMKKWREFVKENLSSLESMNMVERCKISNIVSSKTNIFEKDVELNENELRRRLRNNAILKKSLVELNNKVQSCEKANILFYESIYKKLQSGVIESDSTDELRQCAVTEAKKRNGQLNSLLSTVANDTKIYEKERIDIILSKEIINDVKIMVEKHKVLLEAIDAEIDQQLRRINFQPNFEIRSEIERNVVNEPEFNKPVEINATKLNENSKPLISEHNDTNTEMTDLSAVTDTPSEYEKDEESNLAKSDKEKNTKLPKNDDKIKQNKNKSKDNKLRTSQSKESKIKSKKNKGKKRSTSEKSKSEAKSLEVLSEIAEDEKIPLVNLENKTEKNNVKSSSCCGPKNVEVKPQEIIEVVPDVVEESPMENDVVSEKIKKKKKRDTSKNRTKSHPQKRSNKKENIKSRSKSDPFKSRKKTGNIKPKSRNPQMKGKMKPTEKTNKVKQTVIGNVLIEEPISDAKMKSVEDDKIRKINESTSVEVEAEKSENKLVEPIINKQVSESAVNEIGDLKEYKAVSPEEPMVAMDGNQFQEKQETYHSVTVELKENIKPAKPIKILEENELINKMKESEKRYAKMLEKLKKIKSGNDISSVFQTLNCFDAKVPQDESVIKSDKAQNSQNGKKSQDISIKQGKKPLYSDLGKISKDIPKNLSERAQNSEAGKKSQDLSINRVDKGNISKEIPKNKPLPYYNKDIDNSKLNKNCFKSHKPDILQFIDSNPLGDETKYDFRPIVKGAQLRYDYKRLVLESKKEIDDINDKKTFNDNKVQKTVSRTISATNDSCIVMELTPNTEENKDEKSSEIELKDENLNNKTKIYK